ncbi:MAG: HlyD family efflux transporter periplasmic adaptor subunit [Syntrophobacterales bacterium]|nr:MAG: HlyD family efflux transporter periplasmic adaptor subunit [Syntrophobacterales bacterium]
MPDSLSEARKNMDTARLWKDLEGHSDHEVFVTAWLAIQCSMIRECIQAVLVLKDADKGAFMPVASWPEGRTGERLGVLLDRTLSEGEGTLVQLSPPVDHSQDGFLRYGLAYPITVDETLYGAIAVEVTAAAEDSLQIVMEQLQWGVVWLENMYRRRQGNEDRNTLKRMKAAGEILAGLLGEEHFDGAARTFVTEVATRLGCDRVSLGLVKRNHAHVKAISHTANVEKRMNLVRSIGAAMDEALMQRADIVYPVLPGAGAIVVRDHELMAQRHGTVSIITLPLYGRDKYYAALTLERQDDKPFTSEDLSYVKSVAALAGIALENKYHNDRPIVFGVFDSLKRQAVRLFGAGYMGRKATALIVVALVAFFGVAKQEYRLSADAVLEGAICRSVVAPLDGYIKESSARAGDVVKKNAVLCTMDDRELQLERTNLLSKKGQYQRQLQKALAENSRAEVNIIGAQIDQTTAQLDLVEKKIDQIIIRAPFDGIVLSGDLSQRQGSAVGHGDELFQVAPLDSYRLILKVDERRIADVTKGQKGFLVLPSLSNDQYEFTVTKITPITTAEQGRNYFRVEASVEKVSSRLRPGMEGIAKITVDRRLLIAIWTRDFSEWLRLRLWSWWP